MIGEPWEAIFKGTASIHEDDRFPTLQGAPKEQQKEIFQALINWGLKAEMESPSRFPPLQNVNRFIRLIATMSASYPLVILSSHNYFSLLISFLPFSVDGGYAHLLAPLC